MAGLLGLGAVVRVAFVLAQGLPVHDPWRHLELIANLRRGLGFTLFDGQPYVWYAPLWYRLCALAPAAVGPAWIAAVFSLLSVAVFYLWLRVGPGTVSVGAAAAGAVPMAAFGPVVAFTCHYGPEAFALFLLLAGLLAASATSGIPAALACGLTAGAGLLSRMNLGFDLMLFAPALATRRRLAAAAGGVAAALAFGWWRNHRIIEAHAWLFTWDGLATPSAGFDALSTLILQRHPDVREALRRLHEQIVPVPEWLGGRGGVAWDLAAFMLIGVVCLLASRRLHLILAGGAGCAYFALWDSTLSSNFFRIYLGVFPVFFAALAVVAQGWLGRRGRGATVGTWVLVGLVLVSGARTLVPVPMVPLAMVTPPPELLTEDAYMVNSAFYHPESLIHRFPGKAFIGMPLGPEAFESFRRLFPRYRSILWHDVSVQDDLAQHLAASGRYRVVAEATNDYGRRYVVLEELEGDQQPPPARGRPAESRPREPASAGAGQPLTARTR